MAITDKLAKYVLAGALCGAAATQLPEYERTVEANVEAQYTMVEDAAQTHRDIAKRHKMTLEEYTHLYDNCESTDTRCLVGQENVAEAKELFGKEQTLEKRLQRFQGGSLQRIGATFYPFKREEQRAAWKAYSPSVSLNDESKQYAGITAGMAILTLLGFDLRSGYRQRQRNKYIDKQRKQQKR